MFGAGSGAGFDGATIIGMFIGTFAEAPQQSSTIIGCGQHGGMQSTGLFRWNSRQLPPLQPGSKAMIAAATRQRVSLFMDQISGRN